MTENTVRTVQGAHDEWDYRTVEGSFGQEFDTSIPCQLRFAGETDQNTDRFHNALKERGYSSVNANPDRRREGRGPCYDGEVCSNNHYNRVGITVFRGNVVRLYPKDDYVPTEEELADLLDALEVGFRAELDHDPIEREDGENDE